jgi:hypothetical protein
MYKDTSTGGLSGAYTVWARGQVKQFNIDSTIGVCLNAASGCGGSGSAIMYGGAVLADNQWHQYYIAWRQGSASIESCLLIDDTNPADCSWIARKFPMGLSFNAVLLTGFGARPDLGDNVWFDDLESAPLPQ